MSFLKMMMASSDSTNDPFQAFSQGPAFLSLDFHPNNNRHAKKNNGDRSPGALGFLSNLRSHSPLKSTSPPQTPQQDTRAAMTDITLSDDIKRKLIRRSSVIMSSGWDRIQYDSESIDMPYRSVDTYENKLRNTPSPVHTVHFSQMKPPLLTQRTASQLSSTSGSDRMSTRSDINSDVEGAASSGSSSPSNRGSRRIKRDSVVQSSKELVRPLVVNGRFQNPWDTWAPLCFTNILKFGLSKDKSNIPNKDQLDIVLPIVKPKFDSIPPVDALRITWLGHATVLIQMDGITVLTDPMFSDRARPSQVVGPKRYRDMPCTVHVLPANLDAIVISHNHYDHLDMNSVTLLNARYGKELRWFIPLGLATWFDTAGCENVVELDWWEENFVPEKSDISFVFTPAQHWSKRTLNDDNKSLWGSWSIIGPRHRLFFTGDTGYCSVFKDIGRIYGPFSAAAIPIGAFEPRWFMKYQHVNPEEAVQIHKDLRSELSMAIHWGTFALANEYYLDPPVKLREALDSMSVSNDSFITFKHAETRLVQNGKSFVDKQGRKKQLSYEETT